MKWLTQLVLTRIKSNILINPHLFISIAIALVLIFIYRAWPWIDWEPIHGVKPSWFFELATLEFKYRFIGSLFLIPIIYGAVVFWWRGALIAWLLSLVSVLPIVIGLWRYNLPALITNMAFLLLPLLIVSIVTFELEWRAKERKMLAGREEERQRYISKVLETQENERQRIAQELHDETIQTLLVILSHTETLISSDYHEMSEVKENAMRIRDTTINAVEYLRRLSLDLRPSILDNLGLIPALRWLVDRINTDCNINSQIIITGTERKLSSKVESIIFRIVQEALNNIKRHSKADNAVVTLEFTDTLLKMKIQDDGQGFSVPEELGRFVNKGSLGLIGMQQRISSLGGAFQIYSSPGEGTALLFEVTY